MVEKGKEWHFVGSQRDDVDIDEDGSSSAPLGQCRECFAHDQTAANRKSPPVHNLNQSEAYSNVTHRQTWDEEADCEISAQNGQIPAPSRLSTTQRLPADFRLPGKIIYCNHLRSSHSSTSLAVHFHQNQNACDALG